MEDRNLQYNLYSRYILREYFSRTGSSMEFLGYSGYLIFLCNYSNTFHFNLSELGILMSFPSFVSLPFHVSIPLARPCNPFSVTYRQTKHLGHRKRTLGFMSVTV